MSDPTPTARVKRKRVATRRDRLEYAAFNAAEWLFDRLGPDRASAFFGWLWERVAPRLSRHPRALENLALALPERTPQEHEAIARAMWRNLGQVTAEAMLVERILADPARIQIDPDSEAFRVIREANGQVVVASMHFSNWELAAWPITAAGYSTAGVYQRVRNPLVDRRVVELRSKVFPGGMHSKGHGTPRRLLSWVKQGNPIALLADLREARGISIPFFGKPALTTPLPALVARALGVPLIAGRAVRIDGKVCFRVEGEVVPVPQTEDRTADIELATIRLHAVFERWIRETPELWMWSNRRWDPSRRDRG